MAATGQRTHYQVLGVAPGASSDDVRRAHRQLARVLHPDRLGAASDAERRLAERRMREVNMAWTVLSDPARRLDYDRELRAARTSGTSGPPAGGSAAGRAGDAARAPAGRRGRPEDAEDPDEAFARARTAELDPDEEDLGAGHYWLLRRAPVVAAVLVAIVLFVATAYAGGGGDTGDGSGAPASSTSANCVRVTEGEPALRVPCSETNDGRIVTTVQRSQDCPDRTSPVQLDGALTCVTTDPTLMSNTPPGG